MQSCTVAWMSTGVHLCSKTHSSCDAYDIHCVSWSVIAKIKRRKYTIKRLFSDKLDSLGFSRDGEGLKVGEGYGGGDDGNGVKNRCNSVSQATGNGFKGFSNTFSLLFTRSLDGSSLNAILLHSGA